MIQKEFYVADNIVAYNHDWQYPAITEKHAFIKAKTLLPKSKDVVLFAFPWATLIDKLQTKSGNHEELMNALSALSRFSENFKHVVTVCQHILMLRYQELFNIAGITDVFWTHAVIGQNNFDQFPGIQIYPMPLYPVQLPSNDHEQLPKRDLLFSFIGAKANQYYLTDTRNQIIEKLSSDPRGNVAGRDSWHFNKIVYDLQIKNKVKESNDLVDHSATNEYVNILQRSIFSLCPAGSGPNSIRLWESIGFGSIPVILADTYLPPGDIKLWNLATVTCPETSDSIEKLPDLLSSLNQDKALIDKKKHALKQLWFKYGPEFFIYDIVAFFIKKQSNYVETGSLAPKKDTLESGFKQLMAVRKNGIAYIYKRCIGYFKNISKQ